jgi:5-methylcytosine-specific restriction endonuclease McrA
MIIDLNICERCGAVFTKPHRSARGRAFPRFCSKRCSNRGRVYDEAARRNMSKAHMGTPTGRNGRQHHWYVDGRADTTHITKRRRQGNVSLWRAAVYERDGYTCQHCGAPGNKRYGVRGIGLDAAHIESFHLHPEGRFDVANGITLCRRCHIRFDVANETHRQIRAMA